MKKKLILSAALLMAFGSSKASHPNEKYKKACEGKNYGDECTCPTNSKKEEGECRKWYRHRRALYCNWCD